MEEEKILIVEDEELLVLQIKSDLLQMGYAVTDSYSSGEEAIEGVEKLKPDLILMDITLKGKLDGIQTAGLIRRKHDIPVIYLTAHSEEGAVEQAQATEPYGYLLKPISSRGLEIAVKIALYKHRTDREKDRLTKDLQQALEKVRVLSGLLPICSYCKKIRNDKNYWEQIESYISKHSDALFTHSICPECKNKVMAEIEKIPGTHIEDGPDRA